ncbi:Uncharacterised protein [Mycobacteroides abscessus subsp. abscessus]|nr:Uncharacterised protein [Mycobacteroides abscessus subsp. abscessus]
MASDEYDSLFFKACSTFDDLCLCTSCIRNNDAFFQLHSAQSGKYIGSYLHRRGQQD